MYCNTVFFLQSWLPGFDANADLPEHADIAGRAYGHNTRASLRENERDGMRLHGILITALAASLSLPIAAAAQSNAITDRYLTAVQVEMTGRVDTKNAAAGQEVTARTKAAAKLADGTELPKGTKLAGHIIQAKAGGKEQGMAVLALVFDRAELAGGKSVPVRSVIRGVGPAAGAAASAAASDASMPRTPSGPMTGGIGLPGSGRRSGIGGIGTSGGGTTQGGINPDGGMPGTTMPSTDGSIGSTVPQVGGVNGGTVGSTRSTVPSIGTAGDAGIGGRGADIGSMGAPVTSTPTANQRVSDAGETVSPAARATALPGVMLSTSAVANASGTLTAYGRNIELDSGTQITLGVITR